MVRYAAFTGLLLLNASLVRGRPVDGIVN
ncbi:leu operon leader peptide [Salmonella enterica]